VVRGNRISGERGGLKKKKMNWGASVVRRRVSKVGGKAGEPAGIDSASGLRH